MEMKDYLGRTMVFEGSLAGVRVKIDYAYEDELFVYLRGDSLRGDANGFRCGLDIPRDKLAADGMWPDWARWATPGEVMPDVPKGEGGE